jgi:hypothetical protein
MLLVKNILTLCPGMDHKAQVDRKWCLPASHIPNYSCCIPTLMLCFTLLHIISCAIVRPAYVLSFSGRSLVFGPSKIILTSGFSLSDITSSCHVSGNVSQLWQGYGIGLIVFTACILYTFSHIFLNCGTVHPMLLNMVSLILPASCP